jgi:aspartate-semialdehyde dehydrogenase
MIKTQQANRGWKGFIVPIPNCTTTGLAITLYPLYSFRIGKVYVTSIQAVSGAGRSPGVKALDIIDNIIPYINGEEEKVKREVKKILGVCRPDFDGYHIDNHFVSVSATCTRGSVLDAHFESVFVRLEDKIEAASVLGAIAKFNERVAQELEGLPSAPKQMIIVHEDPFMPQPRVVRDIDGGMATSVGRIRCDDHEVQYVLVSHNTKMGAAKGAVLVAELLMKKGYI